MASLIPNHIIPLALPLPQSRMTCAILSNLLHPPEDLHIAAPSPVAHSSCPPLLRLGLTTRIMTLRCERDPYPTPDPRQISAMSVSANKNLIQRTDSLGPMPTQLPGLNLCSAPLLLPTLNDPLIKDLLMQAENLGVIPVTGALNETTDDTIALTGELMSDPALLTIDVTRLISVMETTIVSMITRVLVVLPLLSTDRVTIVLLGPMMNGQQLLALRTINNHPPRMMDMTDGCNRRPPLLLCLTLVIPLLRRPQLVLKGSAELLPLTLRICFLLILLQSGVSLMIVSCDNLP